MTQVKLNATTELSTMISSYLPMDIRGQRDIPPGCLSLILPIVSYLTLHTTCAWDKRLTYVSRVL